MDTALVTGAGGGVGIHISRQLADARYQVSGLARSERSAAALDRAGIRPVRLDLQTATQEQLAAAVHGSQAVFFAAGVGFNAPVATLEAVDRDAAIRVFRAAEALGGRRVILISAYGTESGGPEGYNTGWWKHYYAAKHAAEQALMASTLPWTILRPGGLTDQPGTGRVQLGTHVPFGDIPRADVAATAIAAPATPASAGHAWSLVSGTAPVTEAVAAAAAGQRERGAGR